MVAASSRRRNISAAAMAELLQESDSGSDLSDDNEDYRSPQSVLEESSSEEEISTDEENSSESELTGKDGTRWRKCSQNLRQGRYPQHNIFTATPGVSRANVRRAAESEYNAWKMIINEAILRKSVRIY